MSLGSQTLYKYKDVPRGTKLVIFGNANTGKTELAGWLAKEYKLLWLDLDNGVDTLLRSTRLKLTDEQLANVTYVHIPDTVVNPIAIDTLMRMFTSKTAGYICESHGAWNCPQCSANKANFATINLAEMTPESGWIIVIDSATQLSSSALNKIVANSDVDMTTLAKDKESRVSFNLWGGQGALLDKVLSEIQNRPLNVVVTAHEQEASGDDNIKKLYPSIGTGNFSARVSKYFTNTIHTAQRNRNFVVESANGSSLRADVGGRTNLDISTNPRDICKYFKPAHSSTTVSTEQPKPAPVAQESSKAQESASDKLAAFLAKQKGL